MHVMCDVNCSSAITSHCLLFLVIIRQICKKIDKHFHTQVDESSSSRIAWIPIDAAVIGLVSPSASPSRAVNGTSKQVWAARQCRSSRCYGSARVEPWLAPGTAALCWLQLDGRWLLSGVGTLGSRGQFCPLLLSWVDANVPQWTLSGVEKGFWSSRACERDDRHLNETRRKRRRRRRRRRSLLKKKTKHKKTFVCIDLRCCGHLELLRIGAVSRYPLWLLLLTRTGRTETRTRTTRTPLKQKEKGGKDEQQEKR